MSTASIHEVGLRELKSKWGWFLALGIVLLILGVVAIGHTFLFTQVSIVFLAWLMIFAGVSSVIHAFWKERGWGGFFLDLLTGLLYVVVGFMILANPAATAVTLTLLIAMFLIFEGIFRIVSSIFVRYPNWGWVLLNGVINLLLGILVWQQWPISGLWVIGLFIGIGMIFNGWSLVMLAVAVKNIPVENADTPATE